MNTNLKRAIYKKRMSYNKYNRCKNKKNWEIYRKQKFGEQNKKNNPSEIILLKDVQVVLKVNISGLQ
jgi:hypothetical protein